MRTTLTLLVLSSGLAGAASSVATATPTTETSGPDGAQIYRDHCGRCHQPRPPSDLSAEQWHTVVYHMRTRAYLTRGETNALEAFLAPPPSAHPDAYADAGGSDSPLLANPIVAGTCVRCHDAARIDDAVAAGRTAAGWAATIDRMRTYGAQISSNDEKDVATWLSDQPQP